MPALAALIMWRSVLALTHLRCTAQYNTCFWALVKSGQTNVEAQETLKVQVPAHPALVQRMCLSLLGSEKGHVAVTWEGPCNCDMARAM